MKIILASLLLAALTLQVSSRAYSQLDFKEEEVPGLFQTAGEVVPDFGGGDSSETAKASYVVGQLKAVTIFVRDNVLKVLDSAGPDGRVLDTLTLSSGPRRSSNLKLAYHPNYPSGSTTYFFNLGSLIPGLNRNNPCTLFESETDYVRASPDRKVGADGIGNHIGKDVFDTECYTFWITFNQPGYILPHSANSYDWEAQIVCAVQ